MILIGLPAPLCTFKVCDVSQWETFFCNQFEVKMDIKNFFTFEEQLQCIVDKGFIVSDKDKCLKFLQKVNYYKISAYFSQFKTKDGTYKSNVDFECVYKMYEFDRKIRNLIFSIIEEIELHLRTQLAYYHASCYGALGYLNSENYNKYHKHSCFIDKIQQECVRKNSSNPIISHHQNKYEGKIPIWVIVEFFSIGMLSKFYADMKTQDKKAISKQIFDTSFIYLDTWLKCLTILRNKCAHYSRLYNTRFIVRPKLNLSVDKNPFLFEQLIVLKNLYTNSKTWNNNFMVSLVTLIEEYMEYINLENIGFSENWKEILSK